MFNSKTLHSSVVGIALSAMMAGAGAAEIRLQILHASDLEGGVDAINDAPNFAAVVEALEDDAADKGVASIVLSAGDNYIPGPFFGAAGDRSLRDVFRTALGNPDAREGPGRLDISIMNIIGFDASAVGNHEFDAGSSTFESIIGTDIRGGTEARWLGAQFPYLSANLDFSADGALGGLFTSDILPSIAFGSPLADLGAAEAAPKLARATLIDRGGETIAVIGATTPLVASMSSTGDTTVKDPGAGSNDMALLADILQPVIDEVTGLGVDKVIVVSHLQQISLEQALAGELSGVDVIISGGSDTLLADATDVLRTGDTAAGSYPIVTSDADGNPTLVVSTDGEYSYVGRLVVDFDAAGHVVPASIDAAESGAYRTDDGGVAALWADPTDAFAPGTKGAQVDFLTSAVTAIVLARDGNVFGQSDVYLEGRRTAVRTEETNLGNLTADANLVAARAEDPSTVASLKNGGGIRAEIGVVDGITGELLPPEANDAAGKPEKSVSQLDIENSLRFNNGLTLITLTATQLKEVIEHGVAESGPGETPGRFPQVGGMAFSFDTTLLPGSRVQTLAIKNDAGETTDLVVANGAVVGDPNRTFRIVTLNFLVGGGDSYPYPAFEAANPALFNRVDLDVDLPGDSGFADGGTEQDALAVYLRDNFAASGISAAETPVTQDTRIQNLTFRSDTVAHPMAPPPGSIRLSVLGTYETGLFDEAAQEIAAYDKRNERLWVTNAFDASVEIIDISDPGNPSQLKLIDLDALFGEDNIAISPNSVAIKNGVVAVAVGRTDVAKVVDDEVIERPRPGLLAFFDLEGRLLRTVKVGATPDMVTFAFLGTKVLVANEAQPADDYSEDAEGSVSIVDIRRSIGCFDFGHRGDSWRWRHARRCDVSVRRVRTAGFERFNGEKDALIADDVRIFGPGATVAQDLEPEYITVPPLSRYAYVSLQENNAIGVLDLFKSSFVRIEPLGLKDWSTLSGLDASNRDGTINLQPWPVFGMYQPDALASFRIGKEVFVVGAHEGDSRDYVGFSEEVRGDDLVLDPTAFPDAAELQDDALLGRLKVTTATGDTDGDGDFDEIHAYGGRSFSIWKAGRKGTLDLVYDSGSLLEEIMASLLPTEFNSENDENDSFDGRSDDKGPEPEGVAVGRIGGITYGFIGLERVGGIMVFDLSNPSSPQFVQYINNRDFSGDAEAGTAGDLGPEGLLFIPAHDSPNGRPLLVVTNEVSGSTTIYQID